MPTSFIAGHHEPTIVDVDPRPRPSQGQIADQPVHPAPQRPAKHDAPQLSDGSWCQFSANERRTSRFGYSRCYQSAPVARRRLPRHIHRGRRRNRGDQRLPKPIPWRIWNAVYLRIVSVGQFVTRYLGRCWHPSSSRGRRLVRLRSGFAFTTSGQPNRRLCASPRPFRPSSAISQIKPRRNRQVGTMCTS